MKKIFSVFFFLLAFSGMAKAVIVQHLTLKNGTVMHGYMQQAVNGKLTFHSDEALVMVNNVKIHSTEQQVSIAHLDSAWINWAEKNDAFIGVGEKRTMALNTITFESDASKADSSFIYNLKQKSSLTNVKILEEGVNLKYLELTPNIYTFTWNDVASIKIDRRPKTALTGIDCIYKLRSGEEYDGQPAGETANTLSLYLKNGMIRSFNIADVVKYTFHPINPDIDIFQQSELLDVVNTHSGPIKGIIIEQNYSSQKDSENYILVQQESGAIQSIKMSDYEGSMKEENPKFKMLCDVLLKEGEFQVNRKHFKMVQVKEDKDFLVLDSLCLTNLIDKAADGRTRVCVEYSQAGAANVEKYQLVKVSKADVKKKVYYGFSYKDLVNNIVRPQEISTSVNQTTKVEYFVNGQGVYALYDAAKHCAIPIIIK